MPSIPNPNAVSHPRIAIVGSGISGLSLAWYLQKRLPHASLTLIDSNRMVGGVIQTHVEAPYLIELGADNFATLVPDALQFVEEMGIRDEFVAPKREHRFAQVVRDGKLVPIPSGFSLMQPTKLTSILTTQTMSLAGRMRVLAEYFVPPRDRDDDESVESFAVRRLGRECFDRLIEPIVGGIFTARSETLSMQAAMPQFLEMEREHGGLIKAVLAKRKRQTQAEKMAKTATGARYDQFLAPKRGMSWWLNRIRDDLKGSVYLGHTVMSTTKNADGTWSLEVRGPDESSTPEHMEFDALCLAVSAPAASHLVKSVHPSLSSLLQRVPYASSAVAVLALNKNELSENARCFGVVVPAIERRESIAISLSSEKYDGRCPDDTLIARIFMGGALNPEILDKSDEQLLSAAKKEVRELLGIQSLPRWQRIVRWNSAMPQYLVGHRDWLQSVRNELAQEPTLRLIGNAYDGVGIPQCIRQARMTADYFTSLFQTNPTKLSTTAACD
jgi:oxygen-dependent protoporphyrinogen oxidase